MSLKRTRNSFPNFKNLLGDHSVVDPPDSMPNSEVKRNSADGSVGLPHVRVGHRQAPNLFSLLKSEDKSVMNDLSATTSSPLRSGSSVG